MASNFILKNDLGTELAIIHKNGQPAKTIYTDGLTNAVDTIADMEALITGPVTSEYDGNVCFVKDLDRGGSFVYDSSKVSEDNQGTNFNGWIRQMDNLLEINPRWFGVKYSSTTDFTVEGDLLQKAIDYGNIERQKFGDAGFTILIDGYVRINKTLKNIKRCLFKGQTSILSRIIWAGGNTTNLDYHTSDDACMLNFGSASFGGLVNIRVKGFDQYAGKKQADGIQSLVYYDFVDQMHQSKNVNYVGGVGELIIMKDPHSEINETFTNLVIDCPFFTPGLTGYAIDIDIPANGGHRDLSIINFTGGVSPTSGYKGKGLCRVSPSIDVQLSNSRWEINQELHQDMWAFVTYNAAGNTEKPSLVTMTGVSGYVSGNTRRYAVVTPKKETVVLTSNGVGINSMSGIYAEDDLSNTKTQLYASATLLGERNTGALSIGKNTLHFYNWSDKTSATTTNIINKNEFVITNNGDGDLLYFSGLEDGVSQKASATGYSISCKVTGNSGDTVLTVDTFIPGIENNIKVRVSGGGASGGNLTTIIKTVDFVAKTITIADALGSDVSNVNVYWWGASTNRAWLFPRDTLPTKLSYGSIGADLFSISNGAKATFDGTRWVFGVTFADITDNRPSYSSNHIDIGATMFDTTLGKPIWWNGTKWVLADGTDA